jgi:hypothetical protein
MIGCAFRVAFAALSLIGMSARAEYECPQPPSDLRNAQWRDAQRFSSDLFSHAPDYEGDFPSMVLEKELSPYSSRYHGEVDPTGADVEIKLKLFRVFRASYCVVLDSMSEYEVERQSRSHERVLSGLLDVVDE